jgi:hypothetical protein
MSMKLRKLRWLKCKSTPLKLTVLCRPPHGTESHFWCIISLSTMSVELIREYFFIVFDIVPRDDVRAIKNLYYFFDMLIHRWTESYIFIIYPIHLGSSERDRDRWLDKHIMSRDLYIYTILIARLYRSELDDIWLTCEISSFGRESCSFCIPDCNTHRKIITGNF